MPIHDGVQDLNVFVRTAGYYTREEEVVLLLTSRTRSPVPTCHNAVATGATLMLCVGGTVPVSSFSFRSVLGLLDKEAGIYAVAFDFPGTDTPGFTSQHFTLRAISLPHHQRARWRRTGSER